MIKKLFSSMFVMAIATTAFSQSKAVYVGKQSPKKAAQRQSIISSLLVHYSKPHQKQVRWSVRAISTYLAIAQQSLHLSPQRVHNSFGIRIFTI